MALIYSWSPGEGGGQARPDALVGGPLGVGRQAGPSWASQAWAACSGHLGSPGVLSSPTTPPSSHSCPQGLLLGFKAKLSQASSHPAPPACLPLGIPFGWVLSAVADFPTLKSSGKMRSPGCGWSQVNRQPEVRPTKVIVFRVPLRINIFIKEAFLIPGSLKESLFKQ